MKAIIQASLLAFLIVSGCAAAAAQAGRDASCTPKFAFTGQWLGGDVASSIPLPDGRDVWIFGDTLYGDKRVVVGQDPQMVHNSIGVSTCANGQWRIGYTIRDGKGKPIDFFPARLPNTWYWPLDGVYYKGELWISLLCIRPKPVADTFTFGFEVCGTDLAHITGIDAADPQKWNVSYSELVPDGTNSYPSATALVEGDAIYIFGQNDFGEKSLVATRIPGKGVQDPRKNLEYLAAGDTWKSGFEPKNAKPVMRTGTTELSIRYHPELKKWVAVMFAPGWPTNKIILRTADNMLGPWTEGETIYRIPEMQKDNPGYDVDTFCYAGKEHPEFEKPGELVFTYACNSGKPSKLVNLEHIYLPQVVTMKMPEVK
jgi:hypothetical protein